MNRHTLLFIDMGTDQKPSSCDTELIPSVGPSDEEKELSQKLGELFVEDNPDFLEKYGLIRVNFDIKKKWNSYMINGIFIHQQNGESLFVPYRYKLSGKGNRYDNSMLNKAGAIMMPTPIMFAVDDVKRELSQGLLPEIKSIGIIAAITSVFSSVFNINIGITLFIMFLVAMMDLAFIAIFKKEYDPSIENDEIKPLERIGTLILLTLIFLGVSFIQIGIGIVILQAQGVPPTELISSFPEWIQRICLMINLQTFVAMGIFWYYTNRMVRALERKVGFKLLPQKKE